MTIRGGLLRQIVELQARQTGQGAAGGQSGQWVTYARPYAAIEPLGGFERFAAQAAQSGVTHRITIFWNPNYIVKAGHRLKLGARIFDLQAPVNDSEQNREIVILATEGMTQG